MAAGAVFLLMPWGEDVVVEAGPALWAGLENSTPVSALAGADLSGIAFFASSVAGLTSALVPD